MELVVGLGIELEVGTESRSWSRCRSGSRSSGRGNSRRGSIVRGSNVAEVVGVEVGAEVEVELSF